VFVFGDESGVVGGFRLQTREPRFGLGVLEPFVTCSSFFFFFVPFGFCGGDRACRCDRSLPFFKRLTSGGVFAAPAGFEAVWLQGAGDIRGGSGNVAKFTAPGTRVEWHRCKFGGRFGKRRAVHWFDRGFEAIFGPRA
jgi:hypothetical protein